MRTQKDDEFVDYLLGIYPGPVAMLTACFDESAQENGKNQVFCVSGVLFDPKSLKAFDREWKGELRRAGIRHYHAVDCAHGKRELKDKSNDFRMALHKRMCKIMEKRIVCSMTVFSLRWDYPFEKKDWGFSEYTACAFMCLYELIDVARNIGFHDELSIFIEDGHETWLS